MTGTDQPAEPRLTKLLDELAGLGFCLPGSITTRRMRCGNPRCRCKADPPQLHGPYTYWTRTVNGRTVAQLLSAEQLERYQPWIENDRRLRELVKEIETLAVQTIHQTEGWKPKHPQPTAGTAAEQEPAGPGRARERAGRSPPTSRVDTRR